MTRSWSAQLVAICGIAPLAACGGGGAPGGQVQSSPVPVAAPPATPVSTPAAAGVNFDTAEYRASSGPSFHGAITAYEMGASGEGVTVGIVDSGITNANGEFTGRISPLSRDFAGNGSYIDVGGHGTAVAETLAGGRNDNQVHGIAWGATVMALRTDNPGTCGAAAGCEHSASAMAQAIDYAWRHGARVINLSLGGNVNSADLQAAVSRATAAGTIIVVAAGNAKDGQQPTAAPDLLASTIANPAIGHGLVIIATSVDNSSLASSWSDGARGYERTSLAALGDAVRTIDHKGSELLYTGTSFSAPQIAGAAALLAQAFPNLTSAQIVQLLLSTARDAGVPGPDERYGMGILDIAKAFKPQGATSLAGSSVPFVPTGSTYLSGPMGDATPMGIGTVILDSYERPFRADLSTGIQRPGQRSRLTAALAGSTRQIAGLSGPLGIAVNIAPNRIGGTMSAPLTLGSTEARGARFLSGTVGARISAQGRVALGLRTGLDQLDRMLDGAARPAFLVSETGSSGLPGELRADMSVAWRQQLGRGLALTSGIETGARERPNLGEAQWFAVTGEAGGRYQALLSALSLERGKLGVTGSIKLVREESTLLGARLAPIFGGQGARTVFTALDLRFAPADSFAIAASMQRGWTFASAGGALDEGGLLKSRSWSLDLMRAGTFAKGDLIGLRVAAPLRVTASFMALNLPQSWDWETETATMARIPLALAPMGSERDYELSYGLGINGGWLGANLFLRTQPGNMAQAPDDLGAAVRWTLRF